MISKLYSWLSACPAFSDEPLNLEYLPSQGGWCMNVLKHERKTDILGVSRERVQFKVFRRYSVQNNEERLSVMDRLEDIADWAFQHPPDGCCLTISGFPEFSSRSASGTEDLSLTLTASQT